MLMNGSMASLGLGLTNQSQESIRTDGMAEILISDPPPYNRSVHAADVGYNNNNNIRVTSSHVTDTSQTYQVPPLPLYSELFPTRQSQPLVADFYQTQIEPESPAADRNRQQTTTAVFNNRHDPESAQQNLEMPYCGAVIFALVILLFCNILFGIMALFLAVMAEVSKEAHPNRARKYGAASVMMSILGITFTITIIAVAVHVGESPSTSFRLHYVTVGSSTTAASLSQLTTMTSSPPYGRYVSPDTCCRSRGYIYPGSGDYCYGGDVSSPDVDSTPATSANCPYFFHLTVCYQNSHVLSAVLCCTSDEQSYSLDNHHCS